MSHLDILLPFALPPAAMAPDLIRALKTPALARLLAAAGSAPAQALDGFPRALAHEIWLARQFALEALREQRGSPPAALSLMQARGLGSPPGTWFVLNPVHIHIARDHLVLTDSRQLALSEQESRTLFDAAQALFDEAGKTLKYGDADTWFVHADDWAGLQTSTPDAACGHNIDIWMPKGEGERDWRKLQNEVQMHWHAHAVNAQREERGLKPVNSVWLWGAQSQAARPAQGKYTDVFNAPQWINAPASHAGLRLSASALLATRPQDGLLVLDDLIVPSLAGDLSEWLLQMQALEDNWFAPLLEALKTGGLATLSLILTHGTGWTEFTLSRNSLRKFWVKPSLSRLLP